MVPLTLLNTLQSLPLGSKDLQTTRDITWGTEKGTLLLQHSVSASHWLPEAGQHSRWKTPLAGVSLPLSPRPWREVSEWICRYPDPRLTSVKEVRGVLPGGDFTLSPEGWERAAMWKLGGGGRGWSTGSGKWEWQGQILKRQEKRNCAVFGKLK